MTTPLPATPRHAVTRYMMLTPTLLTPRHENESVQLPWSIPELVLISMPRGRELEIRAGLALQITQKQFHCLIFRSWCMQLRSTWAGWCPQAENKTKQTFSETLLL